MRKLVSLLVVVGLFAATSSLAATIAYTSFEEPVTGSIYIDLGDPNVDHALVNHAGEAPVNYTSIGGEIGFTSYYYNTRGDVGLTDGDYVGVTAYTGDVAAFTDGVQGFEFSDCDGYMVTTFDTVAITSPYASVSLDVFIKETGWETAPADLARVWVEVDGGVELDILNTAGADIDDLLIEGFWMNLGVDLSGYTTATLHVGLDSNAATENMYVDNIVFTDVPEPASLGLLALGALALIRRR